MSHLNQARVDKNSTNNSNNEDNYDDILEMYCTALLLYIVRQLKYLVTVTIIIKLQGGKKVILIMSGQ